MAKNNDPNKVSDTGHLWDDDLRELTNQPPRWWMWSLYASGVFLVVYFILFPSFPLVSSYTKGVLGWTQMKRYDNSLREIESVRAPFENKLKGMSAAAILADRELSGYSVRSAKVLFGDRCAPCHGVGGAGNPGFPILADDDWLYGGTIDKIEETIRGGRQGAMPAFGGMLSGQQLDDLTQYVIASSRGERHEPGRVLFFDMGCAGCHGNDAKGLEFLGAPNLKDAIFRFAPMSHASVRRTIEHGVNVPGDKQSWQAVMPSFAGQLSDVEIRKLAVYVHRLGGGR